MEFMMVHHVSAAVMRWGGVRGRLWFMVGTPRAGLSSQVTHQSGVQGLFQDVGPVELRHVERRGRAGGVARSSVALAGERGGGHVQGGGALLVVLPVALLVQRQRQTLPLLSPVAEPNTHHLSQNKRTL